MYEKEPTSPVRNKDDAIAKARAKIRSKKQQKEEMTPEAVALTKLNSRLYVLQQALVSSPREKRKELQNEVYTLDEKIRLAHDKYHAGNLHTFGWLRAEDVNSHEGEKEQEKEQACSINHRRKATSVDVTPPARLFSVSPPATSFRHEGASSPPRLRLASDPSWLIDRRESQNESEKEHENKMHASLDTKTSLLDSSLSGEETDASAIESLPWSLISRYLSREEQSRVNGVSKVRGLHTLLF